MLVKRNWNHANKWDNYEKVSGGIVYAVCWAAEVQVLIVPLDQRVLHEVLQMIMLRETALSSALVRTGRVCGRGGKQNMESYIEITAPTNTRIRSVMHVY